MKDLTTASTTPAKPSEATPLARELGRARERVAAQLRAQYGLDASAALQRVEAMVDAEASNGYPSVPDELLTWSNLDAVAQVDPALAVDRWNELREAARAELATGHRAALAVETDSANCWQRARFLALRDELAAEWQPTTGLERRLIDNLAQALTVEEHWLRRMMMLDALENPDDEPAGLQSPRVAMATAIEQAANMVDRFHRIAMRTLRDLRRFSPQVIVKNAGQETVCDRQIKPTLSYRPNG
jgi:hypothetical protein